MRRSGAVPSSSAGATRSGGSGRAAWDVHRIGWLQAMQWLGSARTGSFETSSGRLFDFLVSVGAPTREFEIF